MLQITARYELYAKKLNEFIDMKYKGETIKDPSLE